MHKSFSNHLPLRCVKYARIGIILARTFPYKDRIYDFVLIRENTSERKLVFWHILHNAFDV